MRNIILVVKLLNYLRGILIASLLNFKTKQNREKKFTRFCFDVKAEVCSKEQQTIKANIIPYKIQIISDENLLNS